MKESGASVKSTRHRIEIKLSEEEKDLIVRGAGVAGRGISAFVREAAANAARELVSRSQRE